MYCLNISRVFLSRVNQNWDALRDLVPSLKLKTLKNTHEEVLLLLKLQVKPWVFFTFFKLQMIPNYAKRLKYVHNYYQKDKVLDASECYHNIIHQIHTRTYKTRKRLQFSLWCIKYCNTSVNPDLAKNLISSVIRQKGEPQNGCFKKTKHAKFFEKRIFLTPLHTFLTYVCVSWGKKSSFFEKYGVLSVYQGVRNSRFSKNLACFVFLKHLFWDSPFWLITNDLLDSVRYLVSTILW